MNLFSYDETKGAFLHPEAIKLDPRLGKLSAVDLLFILLAYDYHSPYWQMNEEQRMLTSCRRVYDSDNYKKELKRLDKDIDAYRGLQYDIRQETRINYQNKIALVNTELIAAESLGEIKKCVEAVQHLTKALHQIDRDIMTDELIEGDDDGKKSFLERWAENQRRFKVDKKSIDMAKRESKKQMV